MKWFSFIGRVAGVLGVSGLVECVVATQGPPTNTATSWSAPARASGKPNPVPPEPAALGRGKQLYVQECLACHGPGGKGDGSKAGELKVSPGDLSSPKMSEQSDGALFWKITEGKTPMPAYRTRFSERDRWMIVDYTRTLASGQPGPTPTGGGPKPPEASPGAAPGKTPAQTPAQPTQKPSPETREQDSAGQAAGQAGPYVSRKEYDTLKAEHEQLRKEFEALKAQMAPSAKQTPPGVPTDTKTASPTGTVAGTGGPQTNATSSWTVPPRAAKKANPVPGEPSALARGKQLYAQECLACHGAGGKGDGPKAAELKVNPGDFSSPKMSEQSDGTLFWKITEGKTPMPAYRTQFSERDRWMIVDYLRTLPSGQAGSTPIAAGSKAPQPAPAASPEKAAPQGQAPLEPTQKGSAQAGKQDSEGQTSAPGTKQAEAAKPSNAQAAPPAEGAMGELEKELEGVKAQVKRILPGTSNFLLTGSGFAGFEARRTDDFKFSAGFTPIFLWKVSDRLFFESELELELEGHETTLELGYAQISYVLNDYMTVGAGKFLTPMNFFDERLHPAWVNKLPDAPLAVHDGLLPEGQVGLQLHGGIPLGPTKLEYAVYVANAPKLNTDDPTEVGRLEFDNFENENGQVAVGGRIGFFPVPELSVGYGFQTSGVGPHGTRAQSLLQSVDFNYMRDSRFLGGTISLFAQWVWSQVDSLTYDPDGSLGFGPLKFNNRRDGGYAQISYRPLRAQNKVIKCLEPVFRYDRLNERRTPGGSDQQRWTLGLNYWLSPAAVLKAAYRFGDSKGEADESLDAFLLQLAIGF